MGVPQTLHQHQAQRAAHGASDLSKGLSSTGVRIIGVGHSYGVGYTYNSIGGPVGPLEKVATMLGADLVNYSIPGSVLAWDNAGGVGANCGWTSIVQNVVPNRPSGPYTPEPHIGLFLTGINDLGIGKTQAAFIQALRTCLARLLCPRVFQDSDSSVAYAGTWTTTAATSTNSGTGFHTLTSATGSVTITIPYDYEGGYVDVAFIVAGGATNAGVSTATLNGTAIVPTGPAAYGGQSLVHADPSPASSAANNNEFVQRYKISPTGGGQTLVISFTGSAGDVYFDWWGIEGNPTAPMFVCNIPRALAGGYAATQYAGAPVPTDAIVSTWNQGIYALTAEFPSMVYIDIDSTINKNVNLFISDGLHPNERGYSMIAATITDAITSYINTLNTLGKIYLSRMRPRIGHHDFQTSQTGTGTPVGATCPTTTSLMTLQSGLTLGGASVLAEVGDDLEFWIDLVSPATTGQIAWDIVSVAFGSKIKYWSSGTTSQFTAGIFGWYTYASQLQVGVRTYHTTVQANELLNGVYSTAVIANNYTGAARLIAEGANQYAVKWALINYGRRGAVGYA